MTDEEILAAVLVAASAVLLILTIITLCVINKYTKRNREPLHSDILESKNNHHGNNNYALEHVGSNTRPMTGEGDQREEWPSNYNMNAIPHNHAVPQKGEHSNHDKESLPGSTRSTTQATTTITNEVSTRSTNSLEIKHKTFTEEIFHEVKHATPVTSTTTTPPHKASAHGSVSSSTGIWKYNPTPSDTNSQYSTDRHSIAATNSTTSHAHSKVQMPSYYSSVSSRNQLSIASSGGSTEHMFQVPTTETSSKRKRITTQTVSTSEDMKVFTFNLG